MQFRGDKITTRFMEQNIENLAYTDYGPQDNEYDIPEMLPVKIPNLDDIPLQGFNFALKTEHPERLGCHFFLHDYMFERVWNYPDRYAKILKRFAFVLSPDFSQYSDMPEALRIYNVYRNRWCGRYWQDHGINVIPTVTWSDMKNLKYCLYGVPKHSTIAISTMGEGRWARWQELRNGWDYVMDTLEPETILLYGKDITATYNLRGNIIFKKLVSSKVAI